MATRSKTINNVIQTRLSPPGTNPAWVTQDLARVVETQTIGTIASGKFVPGVFKCTPNTLMKLEVLSSPHAYIGIVDKRNGYFAEARGPLGLQPNAIGITGITGHTYSVETALRDLVLVKAFAKLNSPETFDGGVFLAELAETISMLRNPLRGVVHLLQSRKFRDPVKLSKAGADTWMEFRYGIRPLVSDIASIARAFHKKDVRIERTLYTKRSGLEKSFTTSRDVGSVIGSLIVNWHEYANHTVKYNAGVSYHKLDNIPNLAYSLGLSVEHLPSILWEKVPLSFVADWFYGIGDWLRAIQPNPSVQRLGGFISMKHSSDVFRYGNYAQYGLDKDSLDASAVFKENTLVRSCNTALPALPVWKISPLSLAKEIDSSILLLQRIPTAWKQAIASIFGRRR